MRWLLSVVALLVVGVVAEASDGRAWEYDAVPRRMVLTNARVFDGDTFIDGALYVDDGVIVSEPPPDPQVVLDLGGRFVIPPLGDAHTHRFSGVRDAPDARSLFFDQGVFYVLNCCCPSTARDECEPYTNRPGGVDVAWANGGFTCPGGHPVRLYEYLHTWVFKQAPDTFRAMNEDSTFYEVASRDDVDAKWDAFLGTKPDLVKVLLLYSTEYEERLGDESFYGRRGIAPDLAGEIVRRSRVAGLRVGAHVEDGADFAGALDAGVSLMLHTPGYGLGEGGDPSRYAVSREVAARAAEMGVVHVTTSCVAKSAAAADVIGRNLRTLRDAGVTIALGSDSWAGTDPEVERLRATGVFTDAELLRMWCEVTPRAIFPQRKVGSLRAGSEASFLVLDEDPRADVSRASQFVMAVKDGALVLPLVEPAGADG